ncbi:uncharacterized protein TrAtP1_006535 [Trichoderma atroviride]|uniref:uncharacterized protein n=1 Tax=Hypocrea atroviridis TaxID=63577 RepID=UPI003316A418|nr:hypothetical protein TrAtP1_006535 [Trichoderma atroviride]
MPSPAPPQEVEERLLVPGQSSGGGFGGPESEVALGAWVEAGADADADAGADEDDTEDG